MDVLVHVKDHREQRYETVGDWSYHIGNELRADQLHIVVSTLKKDSFEHLIAIHEYIEAILCLQSGITIGQVDDFDLTFKGEGEPGDDPSAPYHKEHVFATKVEKMLAEELGVDWGTYEKAIEGISNGK